MRIAEIRAEFARRAVQFHPTENLEDISLWGLFEWGAISKYIKSGQIVPNAGYTKENKIIWCKPSQEEINNHIRPMIAENTLEELTLLAGWR